LTCAEFEGGEVWEIAERTGLAKSTTSAVVYKLELDGLLSRGPDGLDGRFLRIFVSGPGRETLTLARDAVDAVSARFFPVPTAG
jgi:DNA-binding MarR family transcriptional regulator